MEMNFKIYLIMDMCLSFIFYSPVCLFNMIFFYFYLTIAINDILITFGVFIFRDCNFYLYFLHILTRLHYV